MCDTPPVHTVVTQQISGYLKGLSFEVEDYWLHLLVGNFSSFHYHLISFFECGPPGVRLLDNLYDLMLREVDMLAFVQATYAIHWLAEVIRACLIFALVEDFLPFIA